MSTNLDCYLAAYGVNTSDKAEINRLLKKYELYSEDTKYYKFSENESVFVIEKKKSVSCIFPYNTTNNEYRKIAEKSLGTENEHLVAIQKYSYNCDENTKKFLHNFLAKADNCKKKIFTKIDKSDPEEKSSACTAALINGIEQDLKKILEMCLMKNDKQWNDIGELVNSYLEGLGFYVPSDIENSIKSKYVSPKSSYTEKTLDKSKHGKIKEFRNLPYCVDYYDDSGDLDTYCLEGICTYFKYGE